MTDVSKGLPKGGRMGNISFRLMEPVQLSSFAALTGGLNLRQS